MSKQENGLLIKEHVHSSINGFHERIRVITNASLVVGRFRKIQSAVLNSSENHCTCVVYALEEVPHIYV